jgi:hypothetical protein
MIKNKKRTLLAAILAPGLLLVSISCGPNHGKLIHHGIIKSYETNTSHFWEGEATIVFTDNFTITLITPLIQDAMQTPQYLPDFNCEYDLFEAIDGSPYYPLLRPSGSILNIPGVVYNEEIER